MRSYTSRTYTKLISTMRRSPPVGKGRPTGREAVAGVLLPVVALLLCGMMPVTGQGLLAAASQAQAPSQQPAQPGGQAAAGVRGTTAAPAAAVGPLVARPPAAPAVAPPPAPVSAPSATAADLLSTLRAQIRDPTPAEMRKAVERWRLTEAEARRIGVPRLAGARAAPACACGAAHGPAGMRAWEPCARHR